MVELMYSTATIEPTMIGKNCSRIDLPNTILFIEKRLLPSLGLIWKMANCG